MLSHVKGSVLAAAAALFIAFASIADAEPLYGSFHFGRVDEFTLNNALYGGAVGVQAEPFRFEIGADRYEGRRQKVNQSIYSGSIFFDADNGLYVGGGPDWSPSFHGTWGYHAAIGYARPIRDGLMFDAQARYTHDIYDDMAITIGLRVSLLSHRSGQ